ncbi:hypothetical protein TNCV_195751 [Trichonephila clavipes]|uniref:Uncharacterized protein n=1 Tax=Trichonephila clavipes TaxID=2585209 RepID=A0A8X6WJ49_TRICX|nr:hypothetical protein TNCV_195751 [Trichonephila clavipes]
MSNFSLEYQECPGRLYTTDEDQIKTLIENNAGSIKIPPLNAGLRPKKVTIYVCWNWGNKSCALPNNETTKLKKYCSQLDEIDNNCTTTSRNIKSVGARGVYVQEQISARLRQTFIKQKAYRELGR